MIADLLTLGGKFVARVAPGALSAFGNIRVIPYCCGKEIA